jgi:hypothetical protein
MKSSNSGELWKPNMIMYDVREIHGKSLFNLEKGRFLCDNAHRHSAEDEPHGVKKWDRAHLVFPWNEISSIISSVAGIRSHSLFRGEVGFLRSAVETNSIGSLFVINEHSPSSHKNFVTYIGLTWNDRTDWLQLPESHPYAAPTAAITSLQAAALQSSFHSSEFRQHFISHVFSRSRQPTRSGSCWGLRDWRAYFAEFPNFQSNFASPFKRCYRY